MTERPRRIQLEDISIFADDEHCSAQCPQAYKVNERYLVCGVFGVPLTQLDDDKAQRHAQCLAGEVRALTKEKS